MINYRLQSDVIAEVMAGKTKHMARSVYSVQPIWIFRFSFILRAKIIAFLHKQSRYRNLPFNTKILRNAILMVSTLLLRDLLTGFIGLPFGSCYVLCVVCRVAWLMQIQFLTYISISNHFISSQFIHFNENALRIPFFNAASLVFYWMMSKSEVQALRANAFCSKWAVARKF